MTNKVNYELDFHAEFENDESNESPSDLDISKEDFSDLTVAPSDWTIGTLYAIIESQIDLDPAFQRRNVWNKETKSNFIESLFLGIPIPQILLSPKPNKKSSFIVLDGKQRLLTIKEFFDSKFLDGSLFRLSGLRILKELNGRAWQDLKDDEEWAGILNHTQRTTVLKAGRNEAVLYEIFYRLNSASVKLSPMELRMSLHPGDFLKYIIKWTEEDSALRQLIRQNKPDPRMKDVELAIRYLAFKDHDSIYNGNMKNFLDDVCFKYNKKFTSEEFRQKISSDLQQLNESILVGFDIFGREYFCRKIVARKYQPQFNRALFDILLVSLENRRIRDFARQNSEPFKSAFEGLFEDNDFLRSIETTTKSKEATRIRFSKWFAEIKNLSGVELEMPRITP